QRQLQELSQRSRFGLWHLEYPEGSGLLRRPDARRLLRSQPRGQEAGGSLGRHLADRRAALRIPASRGRLGHLFRAGPLRSSRSNRGNPSISGARLGGAGRSGERCHLASRRRVFRAFDRRSITASRALWPMSPAAASVSPLLVSVQARSDRAITSSTAIPLASSSSASAIRQIS